jgi:hypothetical protein
LPVPQTGAQRASSTRSASQRSWHVAAAIIALALTAVAGMANPTPAAAAGMKVVVIVGPVGSSTANYIDNAKRYAAQARSYGASVTEIYSPYATWSRVKSAAQGANVLIYLGHGNGSPSPYGPFSQYSKDGFGLNASAAHGNSNTKYYGEYYVDHDINLAANAVVILNRLCYASGNSEWGAANPTLSTARKRVDNFATGFIRANARAVFAEGITNASYILYGLFRTDRSIGSIFRSSSNWSGQYDLQFSSFRNIGYRDWMDPSSPGRYYRSVVGNLNLTAAAVRGG